MSEPVAKLYYNTHKSRNDLVSARSDYCLWLRDDGTCSYAIVSGVENVEDRDGDVTYEVSWGRYEFKVEAERSEEARFGVVECAWAQRWQSNSWYDRRNPPSAPSPWKQSRDTLSTIDLETPSIVDLDRGHTREADVATAAQLGPTLGVAKDFPSWPPPDISLKVVTLAAESTSNGLARLVCTDVGGNPCASLDLDQCARSRAHLRASLANQMYIDFHQLRMLLPDGTLLELKDDQSLLSELFM